MLKTFLLSLIVVFFLRCTSSKNAIVQSESYLEIEFQDGFSNDTVSMTVNGCAIFDSEILTSSKNLGTTEKNVLLYKVKNKLKIKYEKKNIKCLQTEELAPTFIIFVNSKQNILHFDDKKGKYIGLNLGNMNQLDVLQLNRPFRHE